MSATTVPPVVGESPLRPRVFGARPFHTDGDLLAVGFGLDGTLWSVEEPGVLRHWDPGTRQQIGWHDLDELATLWCFSPGATRVAAGSDELSLWDVASGEQLASWAPASWVTALAFSPDGKLCATGHDDNVIRLWTVESREPVREFRGHDMAVSALAFSPDGRRLASAGEDRLIRLWDAQSGAVLGTLAGHTDRIPALAWHPDGRRLLSAGWDTTARVWDVETCEPIILLNSHAGQVLTMALSPDGQLLACADSANAIHVWDLGRNRTLAVLPPQVGEVRCLAFAPDSRRLASGGVERLVHLWDARQGSEREETTDLLLARTCVAVSPDGQRLASLGEGTALRVWDTRTGQPLFSLEGAPTLHAFTASPDGRWIAASRVGEPAARNTLGLWQADTGRFVGTFDGQPGPITALAFRPDSALLATGGHQSSDVWVWDAGRREPTLLIPGATEGCSVEALAFHPQGRLLAAGGIDWLATSGTDGLVALWDVQERKRVALFRGGARGLAFHPGGQHLAVAGLGQTVAIWDVKTGKRTANLVGHLDAVNCVAYSPDGRWLASGGDDRTVRLWESATGVEQGNVELDTQVRALVFAPDGLRLFTGNGNTSCYQLDVEQLLGERE
jgi:WD40 repeat protein